MSMSDDRPIDVVKLAPTPLPLQPTEAKHAAESGHWYAQDGSQIAEVPTADGKSMTKPTLRHARKLQLAPGVTTVIGTCHKPGLEKWKLEQAVLAALTLPRVSGESNDQLLERIRWDMGEHAREAAEEGTRIHTAVQQSFEGVSFDSAYVAHVEGVRRTLHASCGHQSWVSERSGVHVHGYGTKADLSSDEWLIDFKGKDGNTAALLEQGLYDEHHMQLAATAYMLGNPKLKSAICFVSRTHPGDAVLVSCSLPQLEKGWACFRALLAYWQAKNNYRPAWAKGNVL